jgi:hypothetical protein
VGGWIHPKGFLWNRDNNNFRPRFGLAWSVNENTVIRAGIAMMTLDWNLGWTNQSEIGGASFYNQSVSQPANVYTPLFNISSGVPAFTSVAQLSDGSIPRALRRPRRAPQSPWFPPITTTRTRSTGMSAFSAPSRRTTWWSAVRGMHNIGFSGNYNWNSRPLGQRVLT